jgi:hypothetical protein
VIAGELMPLVWLAAGAALVLAGQWCADANRRRLEVVRMKRRMAEALRRGPMVLPDPPRLTLPLTDEQVATIEAFNGKRGGPDAALENPPAREGAA